MWHPKSVRIIVIPVAALAVGLALCAAILVIALGVRPAAAGPNASPGAPNPGHAWAEIEGHGTDSAGWWLGTSASTALELRVNGVRALRLEPNATSPNVIGGYSGNSVTAGAVGAAIGGGGASGNSNSVSDDYGTVGGGYKNQAGDNAGTTSDRTYATVDGGALNIADGTTSTVGGGASNHASGGGSAVGGGWSNTASGVFATVPGGVSNTASADYATIAGGGRSDPNNASTGNRVTDNYGTVGGGGNNQAGDGGDTTSSTYATVGGGQSNTASGTLATVGGGQSNNASSYATVGGGQNNNASGGGATVGGGYGSIASGGYATVGGGSSNTASSNYATVGGGQSNTASADYATVSGGDGNQASAEGATVAGGGYDPLFGEGGSNLASNLDATVGGGAHNIANSDSATVGGGNYNTASGPAATVPGGWWDVASGMYSFAAGNRAKANNQGCFVWADSTYADYTCSTNDRFQVRANGGARFDVNNGSFVQIFNDGVNLINTSAGGARLTMAGVWTNASDAALKENFSLVDGKEVLADVVAMPVSTWSYRVEGSDTVHMGPTAQDFYSAFKLGDSDKSIGTVDAEGVALASIQGLYQLSQEQATRIQTLEDENASLKQGLDSLDARVTALEGANGTSNSSNGGSAGPFSSGLSIGWLPIGGLLVAGLVLVQRRRAGGKR